MDPARFPEQGKTVGECLDPAFFCQKVSELMAYNLICWVAHGR